MIIYKTNVLGINLQWDSECTIKNITFATKIKQGQCGIVKQTSTFQSSSTISALFLHQAILTDNQKTNR